MNSVMNAHFIALIMHGTVLTKLKLWGLRIRRHVVWNENEWELLLTDISNISNVWVWSDKLDLNISINIEGVFLSESFLTWPVLMLNSSCTELRSRCVSLSKSNQVPATLEFRFTKPLVLCGKASSTCYSWVSFHEPLVLCGKALLSTVCLSSRWSFVSRKYSTWATMGSERVKRIVFLYFIWNL